MKNLLKITKNNLPVNQSKKLLAKRFNVNIEHVQPVHISDITEHGFRLQVLDRDYYLPQWRYPYFFDATEAEIRDVALLFEDYVRWESLDLRFELEQLDHPEEGVAFSQFVRGVPRKDLFEKYVNTSTGFAMIDIAREQEAQRLSECRDE